jgi:hypothetical protein
MVALEKYQPQYATADAQSAAIAMREVFRTGDAAAGLRTAQLSKDAIIPIGDALLGATAEYSNGKYWMENRGLYDSDSVYDSRKRIVLNSMSVIMSATNALSIMCEPGTLPLLKRFRFASSARAMPGLGESPEVGLQRKIDEAITKIESGSCVAVSSKRANNALQAVDPAARARDLLASATEKAERLHLSTKARLESLREQGYDRNYATRAMFARDLQDYQDDVRASTFQIVRANPTDASTVKAVLPKEWDELELSFAKVTTRPYRR